MTGVIRHSAVDPFPIAKAVRAGDFVFTSNLGATILTEVIYGADGMPEAAARDTPFADEARATFAALAMVLAEAGCGLEDVVDIQVWLKDPRDFDEMNRVFIEAFGPTKPARTTLLNHFIMGFRIEAKAVAFRPLAEG